MKRIIILIAVIFSHTSVLAQFDQKADMQNYFLLKSFLSQYKINPAAFSAGINTQSNSKLYQKQFEKWFTIARKKEKADAIQVDSRYMIQTMPINYDMKDLTWISPAKRYSFRDSPEYINASLGEQVAQDVINDFGSGLIKGIGKRKYHYRYSSADSKSVPIPSFLKF